MARADAPRRQRPEEGPQRGYTRCGPFILSDPTVPRRAPDNLFPALRLQCSSCGAEGTASCDCGVTYVPRRWQGDGSPCPKINCGALTQTRPSLEAQRPSPMASVHYVCARSGNRMGSSTSTAAPRAKSGEPPSSKTRLSAFGHQASGWKPNSSVRTGCSQTWGKASVNLKGRVASRSSISSRSPSCLTITTAPNGSSLKAIRD